MSSIGGDLEELRTLRDQELSVVLPTDLAGDLCVPGDARHNGRRAAAGARKQIDFLGQLHVGCRDNFPVRGDGELSVAAGVVGDGLEVAFWIGNEADLPTPTASAPASAFLVAHQEPTTVGNPGRGRDALVGQGDQGAQLPSGQIENVDLTGGTLRAQRHAGDALTIGRPGHRAHARIITPAMQKFLVRPIQFGREQAVFLGLRVPPTRIGHACAIRGERHAGVDVFADELRPATENWSAKEIPGVTGSIGRLAIVEIVAVGGKRQAGVQSCRQGKDLGVTAGGNIPQPQAFLPFILLHGQQVLAVRGNGYQGGLARIGDLRNGEILKGNWAFAVQEFVNSVACGEENRDRDDGKSDCAPAVLLGDGEDRRRRGR